MVGPLRVGLDGGDAGRDCVLLRDAPDGSMVMPFIQPLARSGWLAGSASSSAGPAFLEGFGMTTCAGCDEVAAFPCRECPRWDCEERQTARPIAGMYGLGPGRNTDRHGRTRTDTDLGRAALTLGTLLRGRCSVRLVAFYAGWVAAGIVLGLLIGQVMLWWYGL